MKTNAGLAVLAGILLIGIGFAVGLILMSPGAVPPSLTSDENTDGSFIPVEQQLDDSRDVQISLEFNDSAQLFSTASGLVTHNDCVPGASLSSWESTISIFGEPILNLSSSTPIWRDIVPGDFGQDVLGVQEELVRQGHTVVADGVAGERTIALVNARLEELKRHVSDPTRISKESLLWLPSPVIYVKACSARLGATVVEGDAVFDTQPEIKSITVVNLPTDLIPGDRILEIDGNHFAVDETGQVIDGADLSSLSALTTADGVNGNETEPSGLSAEHTAQLLLSAAVSAWAVPPSSVIVESNTKACVVADDGQTAAVQVVGSQLGKSFVIFSDGDPAPRSIVLKPNKWHC